MVGGGDGGRSQEGGWNGSRCSVRMLFVTPCEWLMSKFDMGVSQSRGEVELMDWSAGG